MHEVNDFFMLTLGDTDTRDWAVVVGGGGIGVRGRGGSFTDALAGRDVVGKRRSKDRG